MFTLGVDICDFLPGVLSLKVGLSGKDINRASKYK